MVNRIIVNVFEKENEMGFFGDLIKKEAKKAASNAIDSVTGKINDKPGNGVAVENHFEKCSDEGGGEAGFRNRFEDIIATEWQGYELKENVSAEKFDAEEGARNYSYGLYCNGEPKAMIMVLRGHNEYRKSDVVKAEKACRNNNIAYLNFMVYFPNKRDYISERLKDNIK